MDFTLENLKKWTSNFTNQIVGQGKSAQVFSGFIKQEMIAIKRFFEGDTSQKDWMNERDTLEQLNHKNIIKLLGSLEAEGRFYLILEFASALDGKMKGLDWDDTYKIIYGIAQAIRELHSRNLVHGDLKLQNILLDEDNNAKICDFVSTGIHRESAAKQYTPGYSPSRFAETNQKADDIFALGTVIFCLLQKKEEVGQLQKGDHISVEVRTTKDKDKFNTFDKSKLQNTGCTKKKGEKLLDLALNCCSPKPDKRPAIYEVCQALEKIEEECEETQPESSNLDRKMKKNRTKKNRTN